MTLGIQELALVLLLVCIIDPKDTIGFALGVDKLDAELFDGLFEMCDFAD